MAAYPCADHARARMGGVILSRWKHSLAYALVLTLTAVLLAVLFRVPQTLRKADAFKTIRIENISQGTVYLGYINQIYQTLPLADFARDGWTLGPVPDSGLQALTSARAGDALEVQIPIAGSTQFVFITAPESGRVRVTDLETGRVSELDLRQPAHYTVTLSTVSGTKRAWDLFLVSLLLFVALSTLTACLLKGWREGLRIWSDAAYSPLTSAVIGLTLLLNNLFMTQRLFFYGDSLSYWSISAPTFIRDGNFSLGNVDTLYSFRGYLMSLLAFIPQWLGGELGAGTKFFYVLLMAFLNGVFFIFIVPKILRWLTDNEVRPYQTLIVFMMTGFFWLGWFTWLLTDMLSLTALLAGHVFLLEGVEKRKNVPVITSGVFLGIAINLRANYQLSLPILFIFILMLLYKEWKTSRASLFALSRRFAGVLAVTAIGIIMISLPQVQINWQKYHRLSLFPFSDKNWFDSNLETHDTVLEYGLAIGRLKTQIWPYPYPNHIGISTLYRYFGLDPVALHDFQAAGEMLHENGGMNVPLYLGLARKYPLEFVVDIFLKIFTGLNNQSFEPYPVNWHAGLPVAVYNFFNYTVLFFAWSILWHHLSEFVQYKRGNLRLSLWAVELILPVLPFVAMAVEWRYFLPLYLGLYFLLLVTDNKIYARIFNNKLWFLQYVIFLLVCYSLSTLVTPVFLD